MGKVRTCLEVSGLRHFSLCLRRRHLRLIMRGRRLHWRRSPSTGPAAISEDISAAVRARIARSTALAGRSISARADLLAAGRPAATINSHPTGSSAPRAAPHGRACRASTPAMSDFPRSATSSCPRSSASTTIFWPRLPHGSVTPTVQAGCSMGEVASPGPTRRSMMPMSVRPLVSESIQAHPSCGPAGHWVRAWNGRLRRAGRPVSNTITTTSVRRARYS